MNEIYFVYVLQSEKDKNIYIGITDDLERRLKQHNAGRNLSTKYRIPFELIYSEECRNRTDARNREKFLKSGCGREWIKENVLRS
jgi:putative endonuclease